MSKSTADQVKEDKRALTVALEATRRALELQGMTTAVALEKMRTSISPTLSPSPAFHEDVVPVSRVWLTAILKSLGDSIVIDEYQMLDAAEKHYTIEMLKTADPPTWIMRLVERLDD